MEGEMKKLIVAVVTLTAVSAVVASSADSGCIVEDNSTNPCYPAYSTASDVAVAGAAVCASTVAVDMRSRSQAVSNAIVLDTSASGMVLLVF